MEGKPNPPLYVKFNGKELKELPFSEVGVAVKLKRVLSEHYEGYESGKEYVVLSWEGVSIEKKSFSELIQSHLTKAELYYLHESGQDIRDIKFDFERDSTFILGDQKGLSFEEEGMLDGLNVKRISVGPVSYLSSQVIALAHDELDRRGRETSLLNS